MAVKCGGNPYIPTPETMGPLSLIIGIVSVVLFALASGGCGNGQTGQDNSSAPPPKTESVVNPGQKLFESNCTPCHGQDGKTPTPGIKPTPRDLTSDYIRKKTGEQLKGVISKGLPGSVLMIPRPNFKPEEVDDLVKYIRSLK